MVYTSLAALFAVFITFLFMGRVGKMRMVHDIKAPVCTGNDEFERAFRGHANQVEQMVMFLPSLFLAAHVLGDLYTGALGMIWCVGRAMYFYAYCGEASNRSTGFMISFLAFAVLFVAALWGVIAQLI